MDGRVGAAVAPRLRIGPARATFLALLPAAALFLVHASLYGGWLIDDAGISFAYARNLVSGYGLVSQPGQVPVEGFSNPLWVLLVAGFYALKLFSIPLVPKLLSVLAVLISLVVFAAAVLEITPGWEAPVIAGMGMLLTAANPGFVVWCVSGLENPLLVMLASLLLLTALRALRAPLEDLRRPLCAGALAACLALTRPDAVIYSVFFPIALVFKERSKLRELARPIVFYTLSMAVPFGAYLLFRRFYFQDWLPNTYHAKNGVDWSALGDVLDLGGSGLDKAIGLSKAIIPAVPALIPLLFVSAALLARRIERGIALLTIFVSLAFVVFIVMPPDWMGEFRFATLAFPGANLLGLALLSRIPTAGHGLASKPMVLMVAGVLSLEGSGLTYLDRIQALRQHPVAPLEDVARSAWRYNELARGLGLKHPTLLLPDLGGTLLLSNGRVVDIAGLCDKSIAAMYQAQAAPPQFAKYILRSVKPDLIHVHLFWSWKSGLTGSPGFATEYVDLGDGDYARRESLPAGMDEAGARALKARVSQPPSQEALRVALSASRTPVFGQTAF